MADRFPLFTTIAIVDLGIVPAISQATTEATLFLTADAGRMEIPMPESTRDMSVGIRPAVWLTFGTTPAFAPGFHDLIFGMLREREQLFQGGAIRLAILPKLNTARRRIGRRGFQVWRFH
jgi:hypothetical protein